MEDDTFHEVQRFRQGWLWALLGVVSVAVGVTALDPATDLLVALLGLFTVGGIVMLVGLAALRTEVHDDGLHLLFWPFHRRERVVAIEEIHAVTVETYSPLRLYGGWGIRRGGEGWAYTVAGNRGVRIDYGEGSQLLVGSRRPEELGEALEDAIASRGTRRAGRR